MPAFRRNRGPGAEYVAAGPDLALVRVDAAASELVIASAGRIETFGALPAAPGNDRVGFPVPLDLLLAADAEFSLVVDGNEGPLVRPRETVDLTPAPDRAAEARAEAGRERVRREELEREVEQRTNANEWLTREVESLRQRAEPTEAALEAAAGAEREAEQARAEADA